MAEILRAEVKGWQVKNYHHEGPAGARKLVETVITADIGVAIDVDLLLDMIGEKAIYNKARRTRLQGGAVIVEAFNVQRVVKP